MRTAGLLLLGLLGAALFSSALCHNGSTPRTCCFDYYPRRIRKEHVKSFYMTEKRCTRPGIVLVLDKNRKVCVDPTLPWVEKIITAA